MTTPTPLRAAVYLRLSRDTESSSSIERQRLTCTQLADARGWEVVMVEEDVDVSASKRRLDRPGLDRVRAAYADLDVVIYWKTDRLARSLLDYASLVEEAENAKVALVSATEPLDLSSPMGRAMAQVVAIFAELEAKTMGLRQESAIAHLRKVGRSPGGILLFGYQRRPNPDGGGWVDVLHPVNAPLVEEMAARYIGGESLLALANDLTTRGIPTPRGKAHWSPATLGQLFKNPGLRGHTIHRGALVRGEDGLALAPKPPILDAPTWAALQASLHTRSTPLARRRNLDTLLGGVVTCGHCGTALHTVNHLRRGEEVGYYACGYRWNGGACPGMSVSRPLLDAYVTEAFLSAVGRLPVTRPLPAVPSPAKAEREALVEALAELEVDRYQRGLFRGPEATARFVTLYSGIEGRLEALEPVSAPEGPRWEETGETFAQAWESASTRGRGALLASGLEEVSVTKGALGGRRGLDSARVRLAWRLEESFEDEDAG